MTHPVCVCWFVCQSIGQSGIISLKGGKLHFQHLIFVVSKKEESKEQQMNSEKFRVTRNPCPPGQLF